MSVKTTADENVGEALDCIRQAAKLLGKVVVEEVWGYSDYSKDFQATLRSVLNGLIDLKQQLGGS